MSVEELSLLHRRYVELSQRFRAAWVYHQFLQSLAKLFLDDFDNRYPPDFQQLYGELKEVSQSLNASEVPRVTSRFDDIEHRLQELTEALLAEDSRVDPAFLRRFFHRFRSYDENILLQLVRFYLYSHEGDDWHPDLLDKIDFLVTRLAEEEQEGTGESVVRDRKRLREVFQSLATLVDGSAAEGSEGDRADELEGRRQEIEALRAEVQTVDRLDELNERQLVPRYRHLKHDLGAMFFAPPVLYAVVETNLVVKNKVRRLYRSEERRIYTEYQQIFDLEREVEVDSKLDHELATFRADIERFEKQLARDDVRLDELAQIRQRVRTLIPRLTRKGGEDAPPAAEPESPPVVLGADGAAKATAVPPVPWRTDEEIIGEHLERLMSALDGSTLGAPPKAVTLTPELFPLRLEPREVVAYRRLAHGGDTGAIGEEGEHFILRAAALRVRMMEQGEAIRSLLDDTASDPQAPLMEAARACVRLGDGYLGRFAHLIHQAMMEGQADEARQLEVLRVRLMRDFASLWLLVYQRLIGEEADALR